jgi:isocitrate dehydrogenase
MLRHLRQFDAAETLEQAVLRTLEDGIHTQDVNHGPSVGTSEFTAAVEARMGQRSSVPTRNHRVLKLPEITREEARSELGSRTIVGVDVFIESTDPPGRVAEQLQRCLPGTPYALKLVSNRGTVVWPSPGGSTGCVDHFRARFMISDQSQWTSTSVLGLLEKIGKTFRWMHVEKLEMHDGKPAFTKAQGEN